MLASSAARCGARTARRSRDRKARFVRGEGHRSAEVAPERMSPPPPVRRRPADWSETALASSNSTAAACRIWSRHAPIPALASAGCTILHPMAILCEHGWSCPPAARGRWRPRRPDRDGRAPLDARIERRVAAEAGVEHQRTGDKGSRHRASRATAGERGAVETCVALRSASPPGAQGQGSKPSGRERVACRNDGPATFASPPPISTAARCARAARSPDAPTDPAPNARPMPAFRQRDERFDHAPAHAGIASRERRRP